MRSGRSTTSRNAMVLQSRITEMGSRIQEDKREMEASNEKVTLWTMIHNLWLISGLLQYSINYYYNKSAYLGGNFKQTSGYGGAVPLFDVSEFKLKGRRVFSLREAPNKFQIPFKRFQKTPTLIVNHVLGFI